MLTVLDQPNSVSFARNPVYYRMSATDGSGNAYGPAGSRRIISSSADSGFVNGNTLTLGWTEPDGTVHSVVFTAATTPTLPEHLPVYPALQPIAVYMQAIAVVVMAHPEAGPWFTLSVGFPANTTLTFEGKPKTHNFAQTIVLSATPSGWSVGSLVAPAADTTPSNYRARLDIIFQPDYAANGPASIVAELEATPDATGEALFDVRSVLDAQCRNSQPALPMPTAGTATPYLADVLRRYSARFAEYSGDPAEVDTWTMLSMKSAWNGGLSAALFAETDVLASLDETNSWLTWSPDGRTLGDTQPAFLGWYNYTGATKTVVLEVKTYDQNLALLSTSYLPASGQPSVPAGRTLVFPVGAEALALGSAVRKYAVRMVDNAAHATLYSPSRTFYLDRDYFEAVRYLHWLNGFGLPESLRLTGRHAEGFTVERQTSERVLGRGYATSDRQIIAMANEFAQPVAYRTGYLRKAEVAWLQELLAATDVFELAGGKYWPLNILSEKFDITAVGQMLHALEFDALRSLRPLNYSPDELPIPPVAGNESWRLAAGGDWLLDNGNFWQVGG